MGDAHGYVFGAGGHAHVIASLIEIPVTFVVQVPQARDQMSEAEFFEGIATFRKHDIYVGIASNAIRRRLFERLRGAGVRVATCVAPNVFVARDARIGEGALLCPGVVVNSRAVVGSNVIVNTLSSIDHDSVLGDHSHVTAGVTLGGTVRVGTNCFFGVNSSVLPNLTIGNDVEVMAGALVTQSVPDAVMVGGSPARVMRQLSASR